jgi:2-polyprenyl-6-hydroxyphenyl methylase/3-demethylubiquinone-9 3-methyltransferase
MERKINNAFYEELKEGWYEESSHPIALLRSENALRNPWIASKISAPSKILDMGCGGGFLTHFLSQKGHETYGVDLSPSSLEIARKKDPKTHYLCADVTKLPFEDKSFDVVSAMDLLEHVEDPRKVIAEASRLLRPQGLFFFHTFNRNFFSYLLVIKGVEWIVKNTPKNMHVYPLFIKPVELQQMCEEFQLEVEEFKGVRPKFKKKAFWKMIVTREVPSDFEFEFTPSLSTGYSGMARKH